ncbi:L-seryl-tRNA(Sec) selenium transferase [Thermosporothrix hazakensis]|jgi:L-seryl-tRNA(Ser) seleniumtransferase|uniref:L-seryl-tRNA(Sec) selenium transferase n=2 Tax=Thermosporothrix TaxID=768650 RepID=A0A326TU31_THEHA|nr:L-seryl-tRNA(Sec) selenium transferase [Thermosporothrix hazakensis]PZW19395.1 L-seryl-tRNA(Sec) selenium transferase [Thermosporothrix hazakensis]BBH89865.1 L-seryl-tRNA(Sec) selenium transferase [Thermosporothrix sp. COM3]GCE48061.1 L-seryl-tRNA(Sec) selenium transferase [Thermosporothrix hazakensis]
MPFDQSQLRLLPSVDTLLHSPEGQELIARYSHELTVRAIRSSVQQAREAILQGASCPSASELLREAAQTLERSFLPNLRPIINATGVIINTNLGRSPLSATALHAVQAVSSGYSNLEYELEAGKRGSRHTHITRLLCELTGAEAALVTNNNAAAVLLALSALAVGREVLISRGQLVEIGGGFRVPDVMRQSGCHLIEVGTTNRTRIADYAAALTEQTALLLAVHPSNFRITGFTEETPLSELVALAHTHHLPVLHDLGSGCLLESQHYGLAHEPTPQESIAAGADIVCFSGDKLLGGPQAGILVGKSEYISRLAKHPLMRAVRIDKMTLAALEATLHHYRLGEAEQHLPIWRMISASPAELSKRAGQWVDQLRQVGIQAETQAGESTIGGGSLPGETLPTTLVALSEERMPHSLESIARRLRLHTPAVVTRILRNRLLLDPRTVLPEQDHQLIEALTAVLQG